MASWTGSSASGSGRWPPTRFQRPPRSPATGTGRRRCTRTAPSAGCSPAPARRSRRRRPGAPAAGPAPPGWRRPASCSRCGRGCRRPSASSRASSTVRPGMRMAMSAGRAGRADPRRRSPPSRPGCLPDRGTTSRTSRARSSPARGLSACSLAQGETGGPASSGGGPAAAAGRPAAQIPSSVAVMSRPKVALIQPTTGWRCGSWR